MVDVLAVEEPAEIPEKYQRLRFVVSAADEDRFVGEVWSLGTLGVESLDGADGDKEYLVYFPSPLATGLRNLISVGQRLAGAELIEVADVATEDWQVVYRQRSRPFAVGRRWWVDTREPDLSPVQVPAQRRLLRIPARTAFGTGSHASTALIVQLMENERITGKRVLDVGTGSGILAMVALASGAASVVALDRDPNAVFVAAETCRLNGLEPVLLAGSLGSLRQPSTFETYDLVLANVLPSRLRPDYPRLAQYLRPAGALLMSGILQEQESDVLAEMAALGLRAGDSVREKEWIALRLEHDEP